MAKRETDAAAKLNRWANVGERDAPTVFVGRQREIDLAITLLDTWDKGRSRGRTILAPGAPGAGKTALLHEIGRRLPARVRNAASIYLPTPWNDAAVPDVLAELAVKMLGVQADALRTPRSSEALATARIAETRSASGAEMSTWSAFRRLFGPLSEQANPTLLLVDEVQRMGGGEATKDLLYHLHDQTTFPIVLVCGGLSTSASHLRRLGLSRLADGNILPIAALSAAEALHCLEESLRKMASDVGIAGHADQWARRFAHSAQGWPQHATCHIRAAATALLASGRLAFDAANLADAIALAGSAMADYYEQRLETAEAAALVVFAVQEAIARGPTRRHDAASVVDSVRPLLGRVDGEEHDRNFAQAMDCVERMLHAGVIAYAGPTRTSPLAIPIPSLAAHVASRVPAEQREAARAAFDGSATRGRQG